MTEEDDRHSRLVARFLAALSEAGLTRASRDEYRHGYPKATEAEIQILMDAEKKAGYPPSNLAQAKKILGLPAAHQEGGPPLRAGHMRTNPKLAKQFIAALSAKSIDRQRMHEIRQGHPKMSEAEVQMMFQASEKNDGYPPRDLAQAKKILGLPALAARMEFVDWDRRPAVLVDGMAFAVLKPGGAWKRVSRHDVFGTSAVLSEAEWRKAFSSFAPLDLSKIPDQSPPPRPTERDLDNAALARMKADRDHKVREAAMARTLKVIARILADADSLDDAPLAPLAP